MIAKYKVPYTTFKDLYGIQKPFNCNLARYDDETWEFFEDGKYRSGKANPADLRSWLPWAKRAIYEAQNGILLPFWSKRKKDMIRKTRWELIMEEIK